MTRFSVGGDENSNETALRDGRSLSKRPRIWPPIVCGLVRARDSASCSSTPGTGDSASTLLNSGDRVAATVSVHPQSFPNSPQPQLGGEVRIQELDVDVVGEEPRQEGEAEQPHGKRVNSGYDMDKKLLDRRGEVEARVSFTLADPEVLDCPICIEPLGLPVYQCENGHIACSSCCIEMRNKCGSCCLPIGYNRCRALEKVLESVLISCSNMQYGCMEVFSYSSCSKKHNHEKTCKYGPCHCPHRGCSYIGFSKDLYAHFASMHSASCRRFRFNHGISISLDSDQDHLFLQESNENIVFVLNRSAEPFGSFCYVVCIAPTDSDREFLYELVARDGMSSIKLTTAAENARIWIPRPSVKKCILIPNGFLMNSSGILQLQFTVWSMTEASPKSLVLKK